MVAMLSKQIRVNSCKNMKIRNRKTTTLTNERMNSCIQRQI